MSDERVELRGYSTRVIDLGHGDPAVLVHGTPLDSTSWDPLVAAMGDRRTIRYDVRGHGTARGVPVPNTAALAQDLVALLDQLELPDAHLVGHSWGGQIVQQAALDHPHRVRRLSLLCTRASPFPPFHDIADQLRAGTADRTASLTRWFAADALKRPDPLVHLVRTALENADPQAWATALDSIAAFDVLDELPSLPMPVDVVAAEHDGVAVPDHMAQIAAAIPRGQMHTLSGARHLAPLQKPDVVASILSVPR